MSHPVLQQWAPAGCPLIQILPEDSNWLHADDKGYDREPCCGAAWEVAAGAAGIPYHSASLSSCCFYIPIMLADIPSGKAGDNGPSAWAPVNHMGHLD